MSDVSEIRAGWEVEGFIDRLTRRDDSNSERLVLEAISHLRGFSRDCDALREANARLRREKAELVEALRRIEQETIDHVAVGIARTALRSATEKGEP